MNSNYQDPDKQLDHMIRQVAQPPKDLAGRIKLAVHRGRKEQIPEFHWWNAFRWQQVASVAAVLAIAGFFGWNALVLRQPETGADVAGTSVHIRQVPSVSLQAPRTMAEQPVQSVTLTGTSAQKKSAGTAVVPHKIEPVVLHNWRVPDVETALQTIRDYAAANQLTLEAYAALETVDVTNAWQITLTDTRLQAMVDFLGRQQWKLYSTQFPLPGRDKEVTLTQTPVKYLLIVTPMD